MPQKPVEVIPGLILAASTAPQSLFTTYYALHPIQKPQGRHTRPVPLPVSTFPYRQYIQTHFGFPLQPFLPIHRPARPAEHIKAIAAAAVAAKLADGSGSPATRAAFGVYARRT